MPKPKKKKAVRGRSKSKPTTNDPERKLVSRIELARILGCSPQTIKRMERRYGGSLDEVKLRGPKSVTYYKIAQLNQELGININAA